MTITTTFESERQLVSLFDEAVKPIYPNLIRKQIRLEFESIRKYRKEKKFFMSCISPLRVDKNG